MTNKKRLKTVIHHLEQTIDSLWADIIRGDERRQELLDANRAHERVLGDYETNFFRLQDELTDLHAIEADLRAQVRDYREALAEASDHLRRIAYPF